MVLRPVRVCEVAGEHPLSKIGVLKKNLCKLPSCLISKSLAVGRTCQHRWAIDGKVEFRRRVAVRCEKSRVRNLAEAQV